VFSQRGHPRRRARQALGRKSLGPTYPTLLAWIENYLPDEKSQLINTHVADCDECREKLALMDAVQEVAGQLETKK